MPQPSNSTPAQNTRSQSNTPEQGSSSSSAGTSGDIIDMAGVYKPKVYLNSSEDIEDWITQVEDYITNAKVPDGSKLSTLRAFLEGNPRKWFMACDFKDYATAVEKLRAAFKQGGSTTERTRDLYSMSQGPAESAKAFLIRFRTAAHADLKLADKTLASVAQEALLPTIQNALPNAAETLDQLTEWVERLKPASGNSPAISSAVIGEQVRQVLNDEETIRAFAAQMAALMPVHVPALAPAEPIQQGMQPAPPQEHYRSQEKKPIQHWQPNSSYHGFHAQYEPSQMQDHNQGPQDFQPRYNNGGSYQGNQAYTRGNYNSQRGRGGYRGRGRGEDSSSLATRCGNCGKRHLYNNQCTAIGQTCDNCRKKNHIAKMCRSAKHVSQ